MLTVNCISQSSHLAPGNTLNFSSLVHLLLLLDNVCCSCNPNNLRFLLAVQLFTVGIHMHNSSCKKFVSCWRGKYHQKKSLSAARPRFSHLQKVRKVLAREISIIRKRAWNIALEYTYITKDFHTYQLPRPDWPSTQLILIGKGKQARQDQD